MTRLVAVFRKSARPRNPGDSPTYREAEVANTLNIFDIGGGARANELIVEMNDETSCDRLQSGDDAPFRGSCVDRHPSSADDGRLG